MDIIYITVTLNLYRELLYRKLVFQNKFSLHYNYIEWQVHGEKHSKSNYIVLNLVPTGDILADMNFPLRNDLLHWIHERFEYICTFIPSSVIVKV